jgi:hypothetical protein
VVCPIPIQQNNGSTTQSEGQHFLSNISIHPEQQQSSPPSFGEAGSIEHGRVSLDFNVATHADLVPISEVVEKTQDLNKTHVGLNRGERVLGQRLLVSSSDTRRSMLDNANAQKLSLVDDDLPPPSNSNADADFTSYAIEFLHTLHDDARLALGLHDNLQCR